jgi:hypothetical protein
MAEYYQLLMRPKGRRKASPISSVQAHQAPHREVNRMRSLTSHHRTSRTKTRRLAYASALAAWRWPVVGLSFRNQPSMRN